MGSLKTGSFNHIPYLERTARNAVLHPFGEAQSASFASAFLTARHAFMAGSKIRHGCPVGKLHESKMIQAHMCVYIYIHSHTGFCEQKETKPICSRPSSFPGPLVHQLQWKSAVTFEASMVVFPAGFVEMGASKFEVEGARGWQLLSKWVWTDGCCVLRRTR